MLGRKESSNSSRQEHETEDWEGQAMSNTARAAVLTEPGKVSLMEFDLPKIGPEEANLAALRVIESRKYPIEKIVTHKFPLEEAEAVLRASGGDTPGVYPIKSVIVP